MKYILGEAPSRLVESKEIKNFLKYQHFLFVVI